MMFLYDPAGIHRGDQPYAKSATSHYDNNSTLTNTTLLENKHFIDTDATISTYISRYNLFNITRGTMTTNIASTMKSADIPHNQIMLLILLAIFTTISLTLSVAVIVFCRKKNTVFMLQKCEQESDVEMDDLPTEVENSDTDSEDVRTIVGVRRSETYPGLSKYSVSAKSEGNSLLSDKVQIRSKSSMPLLIKSNRCSKGGIYSDKRNDKNKKIAQSKAFPTPQESRTLLKNPRAQPNTECQFGSVSNTKFTTSKQNNIIQTTVGNVSFEQNNEHSQSNSVNAGTIQLVKESDIHAILKQDENIYDIHGKLEML